MTTSPSDSELRAIVARVVHRTLGLAPPAAEPAAPSPAPAAQPPSPDQPVVALGADHGGFALKESLTPILTGLGYRVIDRGAAWERIRDDDATAPYLELELDDQLEGEVDA
jgi:hypothetical protein